MNKHMYSQIYEVEEKPVLWITPVELVSAHSDHNIDCIWKYALEMKDMLGENNLKRLRQDQMRRGMWNYLSESLMNELKNTYSGPAIGSKD